MDDISSKHYERFVEDVWLGDETTSDNEWEIKYKNLRNLYIMTAGFGGESGEVLEKLKNYFDRFFDISNGEMENNGPFGTGTWMFMFNNKAMHILYITGNISYSTNQ